MKPGVCSCDYESVASEYPLWWYMCARARVCVCMCAHDTMHVAGCCRAMVGETMLTCARAENMRSPEEVDFCSRLGLNFCLGWQIVPQSSRAPGPFLGSHCLHMEVCRVIFFYLDGK